MSRENATLLPGLTGELRLVDDDLMRETTLKVPAALKKRIDPLARRAGRSTQAWMVDALKREAQLSEQREAFITQAVASAQEVDAGGALYEMEDVHAWLRARVAGTQRRKPSAVKR